jgi:type I site-specific restriction-modification system R (restriction) subunit
VLNLEILQNRTIKKKTLKTRSSANSSISAVINFQPNTGMNPDTLALYAQNRLTLTRQVKIKTGRIPDILLSINDLPIASIELKNPMTG